MVQSDGSCVRACAPDGRVGVALLAAAQDLLAEDVGEPQQRGREEQQPSRGLEMGHVTHVTLYYTRDTIHVTRDLVVEAL